jgi:hypothetical protein
MSRPSPNLLILGANRTLTSSHTRTQALALAHASRRFVESIVFEPTE